MVPFHYSRSCQLPVDLDVWLINCIMLWKCCFVVEVAGTVQPAAIGNILKLISVVAGAQLTGRFGLIPVTCLRGLTNGNRGHMLRPNGN